MPLAGLDLLLLFLQLLRSHITSYMKIPDGRDYKCTAGCTMKLLEERAQLQLATY